MAGWISTPVQSPHRCSFFPTIAGFHPGGYIEGEELHPGGRAYLSVEALEAFATARGWAPKQVTAREIASLKDGIAEASRILEEKDARIAELMTLLGAKDMLSEAGLQIGRKPGRPKKAVA